MASKKRHRRVFSFKDELLRKSREAALAAVQIFNNPSITFKSETFTVLMVVAWTYLMHAHYRGEGVDYRYFSQAGPTKRKKYDTTKRGAHKYWELERCLDDKKCPLDAVVVKNLKFLIGLRHEIEHQMTTRIDDLLSARFQAACINYDATSRKFFGEQHSIAKHLSVSLQFAALSREQVQTLDEHKGLPKSIKKYIEGFDGALSDQERLSEKFAYRVIFVPKTVNHPNQADQVIQFVKPGSEVAKAANAQMTVIKETERPKLLPSEIVAKMKVEGYHKFSMHHHTDLWKERDAKAVEKKFGVLVAKTWYWYEPWLVEVRQHCAANAEQYR